MDLIDQAILKGFSKKRLTGIASITPTSTGFNLNFKDGSSASYTVPNMHTHSNKDIIDLLDVDADGDLTYNGVKVIEQVKAKTDLIATTGTGIKFLADDGTYKQPAGDVDLSEYYTKTEVGKKLNDYYLKTEVDTKLDDYYTKDDTNTKLGDYVKKTDMNTKLSDYYTKTQIDGITGDLGTLTVTGASDLVGALNIIDKKFMDSISFSGKVLTLKYKNGATFNIDVSSIITDTSVGELKDVDLTGLADGKVLKYDLADGKFKPAEVSGADVLKDAKDYTDKAVANAEHMSKKLVDAKPTYNAGTITYYVSGVEETTTDENTWFFYDVSGVTFQTLFIGGVEKTIQSGSIDDSNFLQKTDVSSTYTGNEVDTSKIADLAALKALETILKSSINSQVAKTDIVDNLTSTDTDRPLSANQGKVLNEAISDKANSTDVYTKTESDANFVSATQLKQHTDDTVAHLTQTERDSFLTEDDITKLVESASTDKEVPSAKAVFTLSEKKLDKTALVTTIDDNSDDNHTPSALATKTELDKKANDNEVVKTTDITTTIDSTSTDSKIPSAKAIYDTVKNIITSENFSYNADTDRTDTGNRINAVKTVLTSLKDKYKSQFTYECDVYNVSFEIRYKGGFYNSYIATCYYTGKKEIHVLEYSPNDGSMNLLYTDSGINNLQMNGYSKIFYNKDKTDLNGINNSGYTVSGGYAIRNGVCYCNISIKCTNPVSYYTIITTQSELGLPTSELVPCYLNFINDEQPSCISVYMGTENIEVRGGVAGKTYTYSGSFPIKVRFK